MKSFLSESGKLLGVFVIALFLQGCEPEIEANPNENGDELYAGEDI